MARKKKGINFSTYDLYKELVCKKTISKSEEHKINNFIGNNRKMVANKKKKKNWRGKLVIYER